jgi:dynein heavy chain
LSLRTATQVPWDDLRYIFGEIMYGGHIVEDWDRRLAAAYLLKYFNEGLLEGMEMFPGFNTPANSLSHKQVGCGGVGLRCCMRLTSLLG